MAIDDVTRSVDSSEEMRLFGQFVCAARELCAIYRSQIETLLGREKVPLSSPEGLVSQEQYEGRLSRDSLPLAAQADRGEGCMSAITSDVRLSS